MENDTVLLIGAIIAFTCFVSGALYNEYSSVLTVSGRCQYIDNQNVTIDFITYHCSYIPNNMQYCYGRLVQFTFIREDDGLVLRATKTYS